MKKRPFARIVGCLLLIGALWILMIGAPRLLPTPAHSDSKPREDHMDTADKPETPPIDAAAPSRFETASFGLG